ncbi:MAG: DUF3137 domain-containing protein [Pseudomonadota bacterium]
MQFTERTELEKGFAEVFEREVGPALLNIEEQRVEKLKQATLYAAGVAIAGVVLAVILFMTASGGFAFFAGCILGFGGVFGGVAIWNSYNKSWAGAVEGAVMPAICHHVGDLNFNSRGGHDFPFEPFRTLGIVGGHNRSTLKNQLRGTHHETDFQIVEALLQQKTRRAGKSNSSSTRTVFQGLLFWISVPVATPGPILIARDLGSLGNKVSSFFSFGAGRGMPRVALPHQAFEAAFEVHADDPQGTIDFLPPAFLDSLLEIAEFEGSRGTKSMMAGFNDKSFYLALSQSGGFMKMGTLTKSVRDMEPDLHGIFADIALAHRVIDRLHGV